MNSIIAGGKSISAVTLGSGGNISGEALMRLLDCYYEQGGRTIDTARQYGQLGESSEAVIGRWLKANGVRNQITLVTKGGYPIEHMHIPTLKEDIERSVDALGCAPDIYFLHRDIPDVPAGEYVDLCNEFVGAGYTDVWGLSNWDNSRIHAAKEYAEKKGAMAPCISQIQWSLAQTSGKRAGDETLICMNDGRYKDYLNTQMPLMAFASQAKGFFSKFAAGAPFSQKVNERFVSDENLLRAERLVTLSKQLGVSAAAVAIAYVTSAGLNAAAVVGCANEAQLSDSMTACTLKLTAEQCSYLYGG